MVVHFGSSCLLTVISVSNKHHFEADLHSETAANCLVLESTAALSPADEELYIVLCRLTMDNNLQTRTNDMIYPGCAGGAW